MRLVSALLALAAVFSAASAAADDGVSSWRLFDRRLGLFVHWGIYSVGGWHEQHQMRLEVPRAQYARFAERFTAERFDADRLVDLAETAGAEYIVFTAKHHDGFCMWDTKATDFKVTNTPCGRDLLKELADACARRGMKLGLYYSNPDWCHPNAYNVKSTHQLHGGPEPGDEPDMAKYIDFVKAQVTELCTNYGPLACFFWDIPPKVEAPGLNALVRKLQPGIMIDDRGWGPGDYSTPERGVPEGSAFTRLTEACDSVDAESWGYRENADYRTVGYLTRSVDAILSMGGNYLINVGPRADGTIPQESVESLRRLGDWYRRVRVSYAGAETVTNAVSDRRAMTTRRGNTLYVHYPKGLDRRGVNLGSEVGLPRRAVLLNNGAELGLELVPMPSDFERMRRPSLHVYGIPADEFANESVVIGLEF